MADFGSGLDDSMKELIGKTDISAEKFVGWGQAIAKGGEGGQQAMLEATKALAGVEDATVRNQLGTKMFGSMWEDQGSKIVDTLLNAEGKTVDLAKGIDDVNASTEKLDNDPTVKMRQAFTDLKTSLAPIFTSIANVVSKIAEWVSNNPQLAATIAAVVTAIGILMGIFLALTPIIGAVIAGGTGVAAAIGGIMLPVMAVIAGIGLLIAAGIAIYQNWDTIKAKAIEIWGAIKDFLAVTWESIKIVASAIWDSIKEYFSDTWEAIKTVVSVAWNAIKSALSSVWNGIKSLATTVWNGIKAYFTTVLNAYKTIFTTVWNAIKTVVTTVWNALKNGATTIWNGIKSLFTTVLNSIKSVFTTVWNSIKTIVTGVWNALKSAASSVWNGIKSTITTVTNGIKSTVTSVWNSIKSTTTTVWNAVKTAMTKPIEAAKDTISKVIETIKGFFSKLKLKFPKIEMPKLPKFTIKGEFGLNPPSVPKLGLEWYDKGGVFYGPQVIGVGEKRPEFVGALDDLRAIVSASMREVVSGNNVTNNTNNTPININLNYSGGMSETDVRAMADLLEAELGRRMATKQSVMGVR